MPGKEECFFFPDLKAGEEIEFEFQVHRCLIIPFFLEHKMSDYRCLIIPFSLEYKMSDYRCLVIPFSLEHNLFKCSSSWTFIWDLRVEMSQHTYWQISHFSFEEHFWYCRNKSDWRILQNIQVTETNSATGSDEIDVQVS